jgi:hypothetical protein
VHRDFRQRTHDLGDLKILSLAGRWATNRPSRELRLDLFLQSSG